MATYKMEVIDRISQDSRVSSPFHVWCENDMLRSVKKYFEEHSESSIYGLLNTKNQEGYLPIHYLYERARSELYTLLIAYGSPLNVTDCYGQLPIHKACVKRSVEITSLL
ncbi:MAG: hypothetical protein HWN80_20770, partial [Candidatus Lokiarchaeota archaeon]|nr:hypothetical protein [Candidatus Lokiarchaeota archaeon]